MNRKADFLQNESIRITNRIDSNRELEFSSGRSDIERGLADGGGDGARAGGLVVDGPARRAWIRREVRTAPVGGWEAEMACVSGV